MYTGFEIQLMKALTDITNGESIYTLKKSTGFSFKRCKEIKVLGFRCLKMLKERD